MAYFIRYACIALGILAIAVVFMMCGEIGCPSHPVVACPNLTKAPGLLLHKALASLFGVIPGPSGSPAGLHCGPTGSPLGAPPPPALEMVPLRI